MYQEYLTKAGLTEEQAVIYQDLLKNGQAPARLVHLRTEIGRGLTYKVLDELVELGLVEKDDKPGSIAKFSPVHPEKIAEVIAKRQQEIETAGKSLEAVLPQLVSDFNLISGRPGVQFFEGENGVRKVIADSLTAQGEIYSYIDNEAANKYFGEVNRAYVPERIRKGIKKKMITTETEGIKKRKSEFNPEFTELRVMEGNWQPFSAVVQIYNNKVSYITLSEQRMIGVIIEDAIIAKMHKTLFEYTWSKALTI